MVITHFDSTDSYSIILSVLFVFGALKLNLGTTIYSRTSRFILKSPAFPTVPQTAAVRNCFSSHATLHIMQHPLPHSALAHNHTTLQTKCRNLRDSPRVLLAKSFNEMCETSEA